MYGTALKVVFSALPRMNIHKVPKTLPVNSFFYRLNIYDLTIIFFISKIGFVRFIQSCNNNKIYSKRIVTFTCANTP